MTDTDFVPRRVLYVSTRVSLTLTANRYVMLSAEGLDVEVVGWERLGYKRPVDTRRLPRDRLSVLGSFRDRAVLARIRVLVCSLSRLRQAIRRSDVVCFNGGLDVGIVVLLAGLRLSRPVVRDVSDLHSYALASGLRGRLCRRIDKSVAERLSQLMVTSPDYLKYCRDELGVALPSLVVENKIEAKLGPLWRSLPKEHEGVGLQDRPLKVGYFGLIRDQWSLDFIEASSRQLGERVQFVIAGEIDSTLEGFDKYLARNPAVEYLGVYQHPVDMPSLYAGVDISLACYPAELPAGWALSCRFYDSCALRTPVVVRAGTADAQRVDHHKLGMVLNSPNPHDAAAEFASLTAADWSRWTANLEALTPDVYALGDEPARLAAALRTLMAD